LLFALQAAIGAGVIGYFLGYYRAKSHNEKDLEYKGRKEIEIDKNSI
jgi:cobalt/nickel transport protein